MVTLGSSINRGMCTMDCCSIRSTSRCSALSIHRLWAHTDQGVNVERILLRCAWRAQHIREHTHAAALLVSRATDSNASRRAWQCAEEGTPAEKTLCAHLHTRPLAALPQPAGAMLGKLGHFKAKQGEAGWDKVANEAARTVPGRENGGNCDIKNLSRGCAVYFPVRATIRILRHTRVQCRHSDAAPPGRNDSDQTHPPPPTRGLSGSSSLCRPTDTRTTQASQHNKHAAASWAPPRAPREG